MACVEVALGLRSWPSSPVLVLPLSHRKQAQHTAQWGASPDGVHPGLGISVYVGARSP